MKADLASHGGGLLRLTTTRPVAVTMVFVTLFTFGLVSLQRLLGHSTLAPTQRYLDHLERSDLARWAFSPV